MFAQKCRIIAIKIKLISKKFRAFKNRYEFLVCQYIRKIKEHVDELGHF